jgi:glycosyltransferase involved in cell wall biosynthesis
MKKTATQRIWINITTMYRWKRPAVGIIRVESEFIRYMMIEPGFDDHYFVYDKTRDIYVEIPRPEVLELLNKQNQPITQEKNKTKKNYFWLLKVWLKERSAWTYYFFSVPLNRMFSSIIQLIRRIYREIYLVPRYYFQHFWKPQLAKLFNKLFQNRTEVTISGQPMHFHKDDWVISLGLDWDYLNLSGLYSLKKDIDFKMACMCYDIIPIKYPHLCVFDVSNHFSRYFVDLSWIADHIFCISNNTKIDLTEFLTKNGAPVPSMSVVRLGDSITTKENGQIEALSSEVQAVVSGGPYILFVSTIERRKNHETLYRAYRKLLERGEKNLPQLVFVGMFGWGVNDFFQDLAKDPLIQGKITILSQVSDDALEELMRNCLFTVFPSIYEGWGLPVAESLAHGKFSLVSNSSSLPEVGKDLVEYIDPWDVPKWADRIIFYINNQKELQKRNNRIIEQYKPVQWNNMGEQMLRVLRHKSFNS